MTHTDVRGGETDAATDSARTTGQDPRKRQQILDGARDIFLFRGYDGASMDDIARAAGVSKGTLYVYFENKERLFATLIDQARVQQAEALFRLDPNDHDVRRVLTRLGSGFLGLMAEPGRLSSVRVVISIAGRMPELGAEFFDSGPGVGVQRLKAYFDAQVAAGALRPTDTGHAAAQFLDLCLTGVLKPMMFGVPVELTEERKKYVIDSAIDVFMAAYGPKDD